MTHRRKEALARDAMGHFADLRDGGLLPEKRQPHGAGIIWEIAIMIVVSVGLIADFAIGDVPHVPGSGEDICMTGRC